MTNINEDQPAQTPMTVERYWQLMRDRLSRQGYSGEALEQRLQAIKDRGTTFRFDKDEILRG
jgi:hypothetical protein